MKLADLNNGDRQSVNEKRQLLKILLALRETSIVVLKFYLQQLREKLRSDKRIFLLIQSSLSTLTFSSFLRNNKENPEISWTIGYL